MTQLTNNFSILVETIMHTKIETLLRRKPELEPCAGDIQKAFKIFLDCYNCGGKIMVCGNGGSASDSEHIVGELMKGYLLKRPLQTQERKMLESTLPENGRYLSDHLQRAIPAISLVSQTSLISAFANDIDSDLVYAQQVFGYGKPGDVVLGISTSGTSKRVIYAIQVARALGLKTIGLTGEVGGKFPENCDIVIRVPHKYTSEIQEYHLSIYHTLCAALEETLFKE
jgi:D-sedoheptulose 7-phosphate isomerase